MNTTINKAGAPKVSVIVAVYKAENYLRRCVDSLLAQTFKDFEILLVDDGSPDRSGEICDEYAAKDSRVRVFHKSNGGVSSARQCGIDNACGEYTIHADPDDWVESTMLDDLYYKAKEDDADMVICDYYAEERDKIEYIRQKPSALDCETVQRELFQRLHGSLWNKLIRRVCYKKGNVKFPIDLNVSEDLYVCLLLLETIQKVVYLPKAYYHYDRFSNANSLTKECGVKEYCQHVKLLALFKERGFNHKCCREYNTYWAMVAYEAFYLNVYSATQYRCTFFKDVICLLHCDASLRIRLFIFLSSIGLKDMMFSLYAYLKTITKR